MDNYYANQGFQSNYENKNNLVTNQANNKMHFQTKCNKSVEDNL
jgi:hypothetical protein